MRSSTSRHHPASISFRSRMTLRMANAGRSPADTLPRGTPVSPLSLPLNVLQSGHPHILGIHCHDPLDAFRAPLRDAVALKPLQHIFTLQIRFSLLLSRPEMHPISTSKLKALNFLEQVFFDGFRKLSGRDGELQ